MTLSFKEACLEDAPFFLEWTKKPHVKNSWFKDGYSPVEYFLELFKISNGYDFPFIVYLDKQPIGYIMYCDLFAYKTLCDKPKGLFANEPEGSYCVDIFIAEEELLGKGLGTKIMALFCDILLAKPKVKRILIDPDLNNKAAIRCYEKVGFTIICQESDGIVENCLVMEKRKNT